MLAEKNSQSFSYHDIFVLWKIWLVMNVYIIVNKFAFHIAIDIS